MGLRGLSVAEGACHLQFSRRKNMIGHGAVAGHAVGAPAGSLKFLEVSASLKGLVFLRVAFSACGRDAREINGTFHLAGGEDAFVGGGLFLPGGIPSVAGLACDFASGMNGLVPILKVVFKIGHPVRRPVAVGAGVSLGPQGSGE